VFPAPRDAFLRAWTTMPGSTGLAWVVGDLTAVYGTTTFELG